MVKMVDWAKAFEEEQKEQRKLKKYIRACQHCVKEIDRTLEHISETILTPEQAMSMIMIRAELLEEIDIVQSHLDSFHC